MEGRVSALQTDSEQDQICHTGMGVSSWLIQASLHSDISAPNLFSPISAVPLTTPTQGLDLDLAGLDLAGLDPGLDWLEHPKARIAVPANHGDGKGEASAEASPGSGEHSQEDLPAQASAGMGEFQRNIPCSRVDAKAQNRPHLC